jgi:hypothetical protein
MLLDGELGEVNPDQSKALQTCRRGVKRVFRLIDQTIDAYAPRFGRAALEKKRDTSGAESRFDDTTADS